MSQPAEKTQIDLLAGILTELAGMVEQMRDDHHRVAEENKMLRALLQETTNKVVIPIGHYRKIKRALKG